jgi:hypothetical protein
VGRASLIQKYTLIRPIHTLPTYCHNSISFVLKPGLIWLHYLRGTVLMSLSGARKDFNLSTSNRWTGGFALGSNYLIWSTNSLACMYSSARGSRL